MINIIGIIIGYLLGSLSCGILLSKVMKSEDPRTQGSGSAGATNILRTMGKKQAAIVLIGDMVKGLLAVWIGMLLGMQGMMLGFVAFATVLGHVFPLYFKFKGGKGVATTVGTLFALSFWVGLIVIIIWLAVALVFRFSSLASLVAAVCAPAFMPIFGSIAYTLPVLLITLLIIWKHVENIKRLKSGTESKIRF